MELFDNIVLLQIPEHVSNNLTFFESSKFSSLASLSKKVRSISWVSAANLAKLKKFYNKSGYMNNTPADLFERYLKTGMGGEPMIVDYEKSMIDFANANPKGFNEVKNDIRVLYPSPTIWNSHCLTIFTEEGKKLYEAMNDEEIQQIAFNKYGFRTGITGGVYDVSSLGLALPKSITSTVTSLKMDTYNKLIDYLK